MPQFQQGDMWSAFDAADLFLITTNSTIRSNGELVMGRGIAKQARDRFPGLALALGSAVVNQCGSGGNYGLLISRRWPMAKLGLFQVKTHFRDAATLAHIKNSTQMLQAWLKLHPTARVHLNMPGIGFGRLQRRSVLTIVNALPESVTLWEYGNST